MYFTTLTGISCYKDDITVVIQNQGGAKVKCNNNDIIQVTGYM